jgi:hypothetical protein
MATASEASRAELRELRREQRRRQVRRRRLTALGVVALLVAFGVGLGRTFGGVGVSAVATSRGRRRRTARRSPRRCAACT